MDEAEEQRKTQQRMDGEEDQTLLKYIIKTQQCMLHLNPATHAPRSKLPWGCVLICVWRNGYFFYFGFAFLRNGFGC